MLRWQMLRKLWLIGLMLCMLLNPAWAEQVAQLSPSVSLPPVAPIVLPPPATSVVPVASPLPPQSQKTANSLIGRLLLEMAYERDPALFKLAQTQKRAYPALGLGLVTTYGLTLAEGIYVSHIGYTDPIPATKGQLTRRVVIPGNISIILAGISILSTGGVVWWLQRYNRKIKIRQKQIQAQVERLLQQLSQGADDAVVHADLVALVGLEATDEFLKLWHAGHSVPVGASQ